MIDDAQAQYLYEKVVLHDSNGEFEVRMNSKEQNSALCSTIYRLRYQVEEEEYLGIN